MLAMQYTIPLPPGFDEAQARQRVQARAPLFDAHPGLRHKAFLYNAEERLYAPFYIWHDVSAARDFLLDELFHGVVRDFSRHRVRSWYGVHLLEASTQPPGFALREADVIAPEEKLENFLAREREAQQALRHAPGLCLHLVGFDPDRWEILRYSLWASKAQCVASGSDSAIGYDVLHVSAPKKE